MREASGRREGEKVVVVVVVGGGARRSGNEEENGRARMEWMGGWTTQFMVDKCDEMIENVVGRSVGRTDGRMHAKYVALIDD
jgi:hypothetical protein